MTIRGFLRPLKRLSLYPTTQSVRFIIFHTFIGGDNRLMERFVFNNWPYLVAALAVGAVLR